MHFTLFIPIVFILIETTGGGNAFSAYNNNHVFKPYDASKNMPRDVVEGMLSVSDRDPNRRQPRLPGSMGFPCEEAVPYGRSPRRPTSVHALRPGDIDVVAALGNSLIAGNGALEDYALGTFIEHRGVSWCAGGDGTWREFLTLPNILKEFNSNLKGYSVDSARSPSPPSGFNLGFPISRDEDALFQADQLIIQMKQHPDVDFSNDWKMVTLFFGTTDLCAVQCHNQAATTPAAHSFKLQMALDYFQENMPRAFVNLIPVLDVSASIRFNRTLTCRLIHSVLCTCFYEQPGDAMETITSLSKKYQLAEKQLVSTGRYNKKEDFTVVFQPFMMMFNAPLDQSKRFNEVIHISYITHDCFHFSQKGHALVAKLLWNNLLEPVGQKSIKRMEYLMERFYCPTKENPFLFTYNNSINFGLTGSQL